MAKSAMIRARTEPAVKRRAEAVIRALGLTPTAAITMFYRQIIRLRGLPFEPNTTTLTAMRETARGENLIRANSMDDLLDEIRPDELAHTEEK